MELTPHQIEHAQENFNVLIRMLEHKKLKYSIEDKLPDFSHVIIHFTGNDLPMSLHLLIRAERQIVSVLSAMPFQIAPEHRTALASAVAIANRTLVDGSFDFNLDDGEIRFRMTAAFMDTVLSEALFEYLLYASAETIDRYNDRFLALNTGAIDLAKFQASEAKQRNASGAATKA